MKKVLIIIMTLAMTISAMAQQLQERYNAALEEYDNGHFLQCETMTKQLLPEAKDMMKSSCYRLMALCRLERGDREGAKEHVEQLLRHDPYFAASLGDSQRFIDLLAECKQKESGITTASRHAEAIDEAPVPVTLITEEMIRHSGATTLQELLCLYVPGMTLAEGTETNIAMHGIYSLNQDKILFMVDGHRLNSSSTNAEAPDFRSSLDKIQQIEVLRGPASSLYGNVALTAVVNIITHKGSTLNGGRLSGIIGTQNTYGGSFVVGGGNNVVDIMGWGSLMYSKGFAHHVDNGMGGTNTLYVNGYRGRPSYDLGLKGRWKDFTLSLNMQRSKRVPYLNVIQIPNDRSATVQGKDVILDNDIPDYNTFRNFNYDSYKAVGGAEPGATRHNTRVNLDYSHSFGKVDIQAAGYVSMESTAMYNGLGDKVDPTIGSLMLTMLGAVKDNDMESQTFRQIVMSVAGKPETSGVFQKMDWDDITYGFQAQAMTDYKLLGTGTVIAGVQYDHFSLSNGNFILGGNFMSAGALTSSAIFKKGSESSFAGYAQLKHLFTPRLIFNAGIRYDLKQRFSGSDIARLSPRVSLVYKFNDVLSVRGNYNYSFVDAPYIYRACILPLFGGGSNMRPETMNSFNLSVAYRNPEKHLTAEISGFYNILNDLCVINHAMISADKTSMDYIFINAGNVHTIGVDAEMQYTIPQFFLNVNATYQKILRSEDYIVYDHQTYSTPAFHANATAAFKAYDGKGTGFLRGGKLWVRGTAQFQTTTFYHSLDLMYTMMAKELIREMYSVAPQCIASIGLSYNWRYLDIDLSLKNIFNSEYKIGSMLVDGIPHAGRQFLTKVTVKF